MILHCKTASQLSDYIYRAVTSGLRFEADADNLTITYTGGY